MATSVEIIDGELSTATVLDLFASGDISNKKFSIKPADPVETARRIAEREITATSFEELLGGGSNEVIHARNYLNKAFQLNGVEWQPSDIDGEGLPFYAVMHIVTTEGEVAVMTCGATTVCRRLAVIAHHGWFGKWVKIVKESKTANGYEPLTLVEAPAPF
jgi:hypothetical protein